nr:dynein heavy chain 9, axonemal-like [Loxodonta africana]
MSKEKAIADEEEQKVALIMLEVKQKQKDCEEDLAKAEPALTAAQAALNTLNKVGGQHQIPGYPSEEEQASSSDPKATQCPAAPENTGTQLRVIQVGSSCHWFIH